MLSYIDIDVMTDGEDLQLFNLCCSESSLMHTTIINNINATFIRIHRKLIKASNIMAFPSILTILTLEL
jgi:hypothetical protein